jgi:hypothetical protein
LTGGAHYLYKYSFRHGPELHLLLSPEHAGSLLLRVYRADDRRVSSQRSSSKASALLS